MSLKRNLSLLRSVFDPAKLKEEIAALKTLQEADGFYLDSAKATEVGKKLKGLEGRFEFICRLEKLISDCEVLIGFSEEADDGASYTELKNNLVFLEKELERAKLETLLSGKYDNNNAIITIHAGAGGTEAQDWASMLFRMYSMFAEKNEYKLTVLDILDGDEAGIKGVTFLLSGENAYGFLKAEKGVHRLVRISPFDSNARRHTSFASVEVMPEIESDSEIEIRPEDLKVDTYRASGAGGQHVNKTESAIRITHIPSGIIVACQNERSQIKNRDTAMKMLRSKLIEKREREEEEKLTNIRGEIKKIEWGSQIRSYVFCPYTMVKDHRTGYETSDVNSVMNGDVIDFIYDYLKKANT